MVLYDYKDGDGYVIETTGTVTAADGTRLAWRAAGEGTPLVFCNGLANDEYQWGAVSRRLEGRGQRITWDYPGHGASEPVQSAASAEIPALVAGLEQVIGAAGVPSDRKVVLLGYSLGCQVVLEAWRSLSSRIAGVVVVLGTPGRPFSSLFGLDLGCLTVAVLKATPPAALGLSMKLTAALGPVSHVTAQLAGITESGIPYRDFVPWFEHLGGLDAGSFRAIGMAAQRHSAEDLLPRIAVPALVVAGGKDAFTPPARAREMAAALPDSELVFLPGASHAGLVGHGGIIADAIEGFLTRRELLR